MHDDDDETVVPYPSDDSLWRQAPNDPSGDDDDYCKRFILAQRNYLIGEAAYPRLGVTVYRDGTFPTRKLMKISVTLWRVGWQVGETYGLPSHLVDDLQTVLVEARERLRTLPFDSRD